MARGNQPSAAATVALQLAVHTRCRSWCSRVELTHQMSVLQVGHEQYAETTAACAEALVTVRWLGFHRIWQGSGEAFDHVDLFLPDVQFPTQVSFPQQRIHW